MSSQSFPHFLALSMMSISTSNPCVLVSGLQQLSQDDLDLDDDEFLAQDGAEESMMAPEVISDIQVFFHPVPVYFDLYSLEPVQYF